MAVGILRDVRATSEVKSQKEILQPDPGKGEIKTERKRGIAFG
jgi:hypothetical protein